MVIYSILGVVTAIFAVQLIKSVRETLYSFRNIALIGGIIYMAVQMTVILSYFVRASADDYAGPDGIYRFLTEFPREFSYFAVPVFLIVCLAICVSNLSLIRHEGFRIKNLLGFFMGAFYIGGTAALYVLSDLLESKIPKTGAGAAVNTFLPMALLLILCYFECLFIGFAVMSFAAFRHIPKYDKDFIIIPGCSITKKGGLLPLLKGRTNRAVRFAWDQEIATGKKVLYVPSGGQGADEIMSEGSAIEMYLLSHGAEPNEVFPEKESVNTDENIRFSKKIIDSINPEAKIAFSTTNYHVFRTGMLAQKAGIDAEGIAAKTKWYFWPNGFVREFIAVLAMHKRAHIIVSAVIFIICTALALVFRFIS